MSDASTSSSYVTDVWPKMSRAAKDFFLGSGGPILVVVLYAVSRRPSASIKKKTACFCGLASRKYTISRYRCPGE